MFALTRRRSRFLRSVCLTIFAVLFLDFLFSRQPSYHLAKQVTSAQELTKVQSVYIASAQWNSGKLLEAQWIPSLLQLVNELKAANISVFVSIYENGSWDSTKTLLTQLRQTLEDSDVRHQITIDDTSHEQIIVKAQNDPTSEGWLQTAYGKELRRISYLAGVRNEALRPLATLNKSGVRFDKILYINDVVFSVGSFCNTQMIIEKLRTSPKVGL